MKHHLYGEKRLRRKRRDQKLDMFLDGHRKVKTEGSWAKGFERVIAIGIKRLLSEPGSEVAKKVAKSATGMGMRFHGKGMTSGKSRIIIAGACLYLALIFNKDKRTQREIADVFEITESCLRKRIREIIDGLGLEDEFKSFASCNDCGDQLNSKDVIYWVNGKAYCKQCMELNQDCGEGKK